MTAGRLFIFAWLLWLASDRALAQTKLKRANILPGTKNVQLVQNGDYQFQGPATATNTHPSPPSWTREGDIYADAGTNLVQVNAGVVAGALSSGGASFCQYRRVLNLAPKTD